MSSQTHRSRTPSHRSQRFPRSRSQESADPEYDGGPRQPSPPNDERGTVAPPAEEVTPLRLVAHYAVLVLASMVGCLIRLGLTALGTYDGRVIFPIAWSQGVGCGIMGLALARKNEIVEWYPPLYTFWTTGTSHFINSALGATAMDERLTGRRCCVHHDIFDLDGRRLSCICEF
jgi:hypothetical protein